MARSKKPAPPAKPAAQTQLEGLGLDPSLAQQYAGSMKKGGPVKKTGIYKLHKGERVVPARKRK
jgi:hypothetical protein